MCRAVDRGIVDRPDEAVATAVERLDVARVFRVVIEGLPEFFDGAVEAEVEVDEGIFRPKFFLEFVAGDDRARALEQCRKDLKRLLLELDPNARLAQLAGFQIQFEHPEAQDPRIGRGLRHPSHPYKMIESLHRLGAQELFRFRSYSDSSHLFSA